MNSKLIALIIVIILVGIGGYILYSSPVDSTVSQKPAGQDILDLLAQMKNVQINQQIFSASSWTALEDFSAPIPNDTPGRPNPFATIGGTTVNKTNSVVQSAPNISTNKKVVIPANKI